MQSQLTALLDQGLDEAQICAGVLSLAQHQSLSWAARLQALAHGPEPRAAISRLLLLGDTIWAQPWPTSLDPLFHEGSYAARLLGILLRHAQDPSALLQELAATPLRYPSQGELVLEMQHRLGKGESLDDVLGFVRTREYLRIIRGEYEQARLESICWALSELAAACVQIALWHTDPRLTQSVVVFGMGKLAGHELNFLSDIDLIFFHSDDTIDEGDEGKAHRARNRLFTQLRRVLRALEGKPPFQPLFRVDLRLRPFGSRGPLSMSLRAAESYYERYGRDWERQAWLRARPIAGNLALGEQLLERLSPFVYRRSISMAIFEEIQEVMQRAQARARPWPSDEGEAFNLKLDRGGIREIEFFVQALQLLHGGKNPTLKTGSTLRGLDRLASQGLISDREHERLGAAYRWYRKLEHRVQIDDGQQSHEWPTSSTQTALLFRRILQRSWNDPLDQAAQTQLLQEHRSNVMSIGATIASASGRPARDRNDPQVLHERAMRQACDEGARPQVRAQALARMGLRDPQDAAALIEHLCTRSGSAFSERGPGRAGAIALLKACLESADPHSALTRLSVFSGRCPAHYAIWRIFADPNNQEFVRQIADLFGVSEPLSQGLINSRGHGTGDGVIALLSDARASALPTRSQMVQRMQKTSQRSGTLIDLESCVQALLHFKHAELLRIGLFDLGHRPGPAPVGMSLSTLADLIVRTLLRNLVHHERDARTPQPPAPVTVGLFALGKYGMQAMDYGSDLDIMMVYDSPSQDPRVGTWASKLCTRLTSLLQSLHQGGRLYEVDTRLRPSGRSGLLVSSLSAFRRYHSKVLPVWERIAMLRARAVAELHVDPRLQKVQPSALPGTMCSTVLDQVLLASCKRGPSAPGEIFSDLHPLMQRIQEELTREDDQYWDLKSGRGGCMEFEFLVSALQLSKGMFGPQTHDFFALAESFEPHELPSGLTRAYKFQRQLLNRLRLSVGAGKSGEQDRLHLESPRLAALGRRMGMPDAQALVRALAQARSQIHVSFLAGSKNAPHASGS